MTAVTTVTFDMWETIIIEDRELGLKRAQLRIDGAAEALSLAGRPFQEERLWDAYWACAKTCSDIRVQERDIPFDDQVLIFIDAVEPGLSADLPADTVQRIGRAYDHSFFDFPTPIHPDAFDTLFQLKQRGFNLGLISNTGMTPGSTVQTYMEQLGILRFFDTLVFSDQVRLAKPAKEMFYRALRGLNASPEATVHVGDDRMKDVAAAKASKNATPKCNKRLRTSRTRAGSEDAFDHAHRPSTVRGAVQ